MAKKGKKRSSVRNVLCQYRLCRRQSVTQDYNASIEMHYCIKHLNWYQKENRDKDKVPSGFAICKMADDITGEKCGGQIYYRSMCVTCLQNKTCPMTEELRPGCFPSCAKCGSNL